MLKINEKNLINGKDIYSFVEVKTRYDIWLKRCIEIADLIENKDYFCAIKQKLTAGRPETIYKFTLESAKEICIVSATSKAKELRRWLIQMSESFDKGKSFTATQIESLIDLSKCMTLISIQKDAEKKHFNLHNNKYDWYEYRAAILGYSTKDIIKAMQNVNKKHHETRTSLIQLDSNELIRAGVIDLMICLGKSIEYATNIGNICKSMAQKMELGNHIWDDTSENPLKINQRQINKTKEIYKNLNLKAIQ